MFAKVGIISEFCAVWLATRGVGIRSFNVVSKPLPEVEREGRDRRRGHCVGRNAPLELVCNVLEAHGLDADIDHAVRVAPLVVVPREDLDQVAYDLGAECIEDGAV